LGKLIVTEFTTLDGVAQAPGAPDEDRDDGFEHGGWQAPYFADEASGEEAGDESGEDMFEEARRMDALLLGRRTYEIFAAYWPTGPEDSPFTELLNRVPKYVASRTLSDPLGWSGSSVLTGDVPTAVRELKDRYGEVHVIGSLDLVQTLLRESLIDRLRLWQYPLLLGSGKKVFGDGVIPTTLRLTGSITHPNGSLQLTYETVGRPTYGVMGDEVSG
jgi:dihydrofolate reductase